jgi:hypothetical protein
MADPRQRWLPTASSRAWRHAFARRAMLAALFASPLLGRRAGAAAAPFPDEVDILIAGPPGGRLDQFAQDLLPPLMRDLPAGVGLHRDVAGGADGVTGANRFEARGAPDGASILLMPGEAALAWLIGDPRARFDAGSLLPVLAGVAPGVLMSRRPVEAMRGTAPLRVAAGRPDGPGLAGLLALDLLALHPEPAFGGPDAADLERVILANGADAAFVVGVDAPQGVARLARAGLVPVFTLGVPGPDAAVQRDPLLPDVPSLPELAARLRGARPSGALYDAWRAVSVAAQVTSLLALPTLTPASLVSFWRQAALRTVPLIASANGAAARLLACPDANQFLAPVTGADTATLLALRHWLASRPGWQPA